jgi:type VI secretion system protein ImpK
MGNDYSEDPFAPRDAAVFRPRPGAGQRGPDRPVAGEMRPPSARARFPGRAAVPGSMRDFSAAGLNALLQAASPLLIVMGQLRTSLKNPDIAGLRRQMLDQIREFEERARAGGVTHETSLAARYVLCGALDEAVLSTPWGGSSEWGSQTLLVTMHRETSSGEKFFDMLDRICADPARYIELMELQYLSLALGFQGKYAVVERGQSRLAEIQTDLHRRIRTFRGVPAPELSLHWRGMQDRRNPIIRYVPWWVVGTLTLVVLTGAFIFFHTRLAELSAPISSRLAHVGVVAAAPAVPAAVPSAAPRLKELLHGDESAGVLSVEERGNQTVVTLIATDLFGSGSAKVNPGYYSALERVARALNQVSGQVFIIGHTDDVPLRSLKYRDNYDLSRARATEVVKLLALAIDNAGRLQGSGLGDSEPRYTPASQPDNRARNRRVEIVHVSGS